MICLSYYVNIMYCYFFTSYFAFGRGLSYYVLLLFYFVLCLWSGFVILCIVTKVIITTAIIPVNRSTLLIVFIINFFIVHYALHYYCSCGSYTFYTIVIKSKHACKFKFFNY